MSAQKGSINNRRDCHGINNSRTVGGAGHSPQESFALSIRVMTQIIIMRTFTGKFVTVTALTCFRGASPACLSHASATAAVQSSTISRSGRNRVKDTVLSLMSCFPTCQHYRDRDDGLVQTASEVPALSSGSPVRPPWPVCTHVPPSSQVSLGKPQSR